MTGDLHVIPTDDLRDHRGRADCWCQPSVIRVDDETGAPLPKGHVIIVHHSADGRELVETHGVQ